MNRLAISGCNHCSCVCVLHHGIVFMSSSLFSEGCHRLQQYSLLVQGFEAEVNRM